VIDLNKVYRNRWALSWSFLLSILFIFPFAINNNYFVDDWLRSDTGNSGWEENGRPLASFMMSAMSLFPNGKNVFGDGALLDVFPLTLIISSALLVASAYAFCVQMDITSRLKVFLICSLPVCNPFWVGNIQFRHDSALMAASFLLAVLAAIASPRGRIMLLTSFAMLTASLSLYQASINAYIAMSICIIFNDYLRRDRFDIKLAFYLALTILVSYVVYSKLVMPIAHLSDYAISNSKILQLNKEFPLRVFNNFINYFRFLIDNSPRFYLTLWFVAIAASIASCVKKFGFSLKALYCVLFIIILFLCSFGALSMFERPAIAPRTMMASSIIMMFLVYISTGWSSTVTATCSSVMIIISFIFSYIISSAMNAVERNDRFLATQIASVYFKHYNADHKNIYITGKPRLPKYAVRVTKSFSMARYMVISAFNNYRFKYSLMSQYGISSGYPAPKVAEEYEIFLRKDDKQTIYSDALFDTFYYKDAIVFKFK